MPTNIKNPKQLNIATVFSGVGAFEQALDALRIPTNICFACDNGERELTKSFEELKNEIGNLRNEETSLYIKKEYAKHKKQNFIKTTYFANYKISEDNWFEDIRFLDGKPWLNKVDIFVGGSPCQSFSNMGYRKGLEDARGTLFYDFARLVKEIQPKVFIFENVVGMLTHDHGRTWETIKGIFDSLNYTYHFAVLNSMDYGIPQNRKRLFVVGFKDSKFNFSFPKPVELKTTVFDYLEPHIPQKYYLARKGFEFVTTHPGRAKINETIMRTQKANQEFNWNGDFIFEPLNPEIHSEEILKRAYVGEWNNQKGVARLLTPRECFRLMGFPDSFVIPVIDQQAYRQAGNSIVVNVLTSIMKEVIKTGVFNEKD